MTNVALQAPYFPDPTKGRPVFFGSIFVGDPDTDPEVLGNQKQISVVQGDGTVVQVSQPVNTSAGGVPELNGSPVSLRVSGSYSLKVLNKAGSQVYFEARNNGDGSLNVKDFGAKGDGSDATVAIRSAQAESEITGEPLFFPVGKYEITSTIFTGDNKAIYWFGPTSGQLDTDNNPSAQIIFTGQGVDDNMVEMGNNTNLQLRGILYSTSDEDQQWNIFKAGTAQGAAAGWFRVTSNTFKDIGGRALWLSGGNTGIEWYGSIDQNVFQNVANCWTIDGNGEVVRSDNQFITQGNSNFTPEPGIADAWIYEHNSFIKMSGHNVFSDTSNKRDFMRFEDCRKGVFTGALTIERPDNLAPTTDAIHITTNAGSINKGFSIENLNYVASDLTGAFTGFVIRHDGAGSMQYLKVDNYSGAMNDIAAIDNLPHFKMDTMPQEISIGTYDASPARCPLLEVPEGAISNSGTDLLAGIRFANAITRHTVLERFTVLAGQTGTTPGNALIDFFYRQRATLSQILPMRLDISSDAADSAGESVTFYINSDASKSDTVVMTDTGEDQSKEFALRDQYHRDPSTSTSDSAFLKYDSTGLASSSREFVVSLTYYEIPGGGTNSNGVLKVA